MKFSLMIPTRKRPKQLELLIESIIKNTNKMEDIEIHFGVDIDDLVTIDLVSKLKIKYSKYNLELHVRERGNSVVNHYINWMAVSFCVGEYIIGLNDDCLFKTKGWDIKSYNKLYEYLKDKPDGIVLGLVEDMEIYRIKENKNIASDFPLISKKAVDVLGFFLNPDYLNCGADDDICILYKAIDRLLDLRDCIVIQHWPPEFKGLDNGYSFVNDGSNVKVEVISITKNKFRVNNITLPIEKRIAPLLTAIKNAQIEDNL